MEKFGFSINLVIFFFGACVIVKLFLDQFGKRKEHLDISHSFPVASFIDF